MIVVTDRGDIERNLIGFKPTFFKSGNLANLDLTPIKEETENGKGSEEEQVRLRRG